MASNKNIQALTEKLAPEVFEFYIIHQDEIDKNIMQYFAKEPNSQFDAIELEQAKNGHFIGNPLSLNLCSFTYRPQNQADVQLKSIIDKFNRNRPCELGDFLLEEKKVTSKPLLNRPAFKSNSMTNLLTDLKTALKPKPKLSSRLEYGSMSTEAHSPQGAGLMTEPPSDFYIPVRATKELPSVSFRTTFHLNMLEAAKDWRLSTNPAKLSWKKKSVDAIDSPDTAFSPELPPKSKEQLFQNRKSHSFLNITASNYASKPKVSRHERSLGNPQDSKFRSSRLESETSGTQLIEDSFKLGLKHVESSTHDNKTLPKLNHTHLKTNASEESEAHPQTITTKDSSRPALRVGGKSLSHLRTNINNYPSTLKN